MSLQEISLGPRETKLLFTLEAEDRHVFRTADARRILATTEDSVKGVLRRLRRKGRILEIEKGTHLLVPARAGVEGAWSEPPYILVPWLVEAYYVGFWSALNHWGLTEQVPRTVFVATRRQKRSVRFGPSTFQFVRLAPWKFFGITEAEIARRSFRVSDREKTVVDCLELPRYAGGVQEVAKAIWEGRRDLDFPKLLAYAKRQRVDALVRRLGYLLDVLGLAEGVRGTIARKPFKGHAWFDPAGPEDRLAYSKEYGLILNRSEAEILAWSGA